MTKTSEQNLIETKAALEAAKAAKDAADKVHQEAVMEVRRNRQRAEKEKLEEFKQETGGIYTSEFKEWASVTVDSRSKTAICTSYEWFQPTGEVEFSPEELRALRDELNSLDLD